MGHYYPNDDPFLPKSWKEVSPVPIHSDLHPQVQSHYSPRKCYHLTRSNPDERQGPVLNYKNAISVGI